MCVGGGWGGGYFFLSRREIRSRGPGERKNTVGPVLPDPTEN